MHSFQSARLASPIRNLRVVPGINWRETAVNSLILRRGKSLIRNSGGAQTREKCVKESPIVEINYIAADPLQCCDLHSLIKELNSGKPEGVFARRLNPPNPGSSSEFLRHLNSNLGLTAQVIS